MKSREILSTEDRYVIQLNPANSELLTKCYQALLIAEAEIEDKDKALQDTGGIILEFAKKQAEDYKNLISKDKEIAELKEMVKDQSRALGVAGTLNEEKISEISALKEEVERLNKEIETSNKTMIESQVFKRDQLNPEFLKIIDEIDSNLNK